MAFVFGVWLSLVECLVRVQEAAGSNPATPTTSSRTAVRGDFFVCVILFGVLCLGQKAYLKMLPVLKEGGFASVDSTNQYQEK